MDATRFAKGLTITIDPNIVSAVPVFRGTRVPVQTLFDYVADGYTLEEFLDNFPTVKREDAILVLEEATPYLAVGASHSSRFSSMKVYHVN